MHERSVSNNFLIIALVGIVILTCFSPSYSSDGSSGPASAALWGYGLILFAAMGLTIYSYKDGVQAVGPNPSTWNFLVAALTSSAVPGSVAGIVLWLFMLNAFYFKLINEGKIPTEYYTYQNLSLFIVTLQLVALYKFIRTSFSGEGKPADKTTQQTASALIYLLGTANAVAAAIMTIILKFFTTDG